MHLQVVCGGALNAIGVSATLLLWHSGTLALWCDGAMVRWCDGAMITADGRSDTLIERIGVAAIVVGSTRKKIMESRELKRKR